MTYQAELIEEGS